MTFSRKKIADGVFFTKIQDNRYKTNMVSFSFLTERQIDKASLNALVPRVLAGRNAKFPEGRLLKNQEAALYSSKIIFNEAAVGDTQVLEIAVSAIDDKYALSQEPITALATEMLLDCIFRPRLTDGVFNADDVEQDKKALIEAIEADINEKSVYAYNRAAEILYAGEPSAIHKLGTVESAKKITPDTLYAAYQKLLSSAQIEIIAAGCNAFSSIEQQLRSAFTDIARQGVVESTSNYSKIKETPVEKVEKLPVLQSKMVIGFKTTSRDLPALALMSMIYGGTASSKLFMNVRERLSLCYSVWARFNRHKGTLTVDCGVEDSNIEQAREEILLQLAEMQKGNFTEDELNVAKETLFNHTKSVSDSIGALSNWYFTKIYANELETPEQAIARYRGITRDQIISAANTMTLDTVYVLTGNTPAE